MTRQGPNSAHPHDPDADRLSAAWNDIVEGFPPSTDSADAELIATVRSLHASAPDHRPQSEFRNNLREQLMDTAVPITKPGFARVGQARDSFIGMRPARAARSRIPQVVRGGAVRWVAIAATIALLLTTAFGAWRGGIIPSNQKPNGTNVAAPFLGATPESSGTPAADPCGNVPRYIPCGGNSEVGVGMFDPKSVPGEALAVTKAQLQGWELDGSETVQFSTPVEPVLGVAVDVVIMGAYRATFSAPVSVFRAYPGGGGTWQYPDSGTAIELSRGDSVSYQIGTKTEVENPFTATTLKFKTILFYDGNSSPENLMADGNFRIRVDGNGTLTEPLAELGAPEISVRLGYISPMPGMELPSATRFYTPVIGPVASTQALGGSNEGFVVWVSTDASRG
jgi:hypothetical protein